MTRGDGLRYVSLTEGETQDGDNIEADLRHPEEASNYNDGTKEIELLQPGENDI